MLSIRHYLPFCTLALFGMTNAQFAATTTFDFASNAKPTDLRISTDLIEDNTPGLLSHKFDEQNVVFRDGFMELIVPGGQSGKQVISSAEIATDFDVLYGSVRTYAILTETAGVCNGMFQYASDSQETDIEWISDPESNSNKDSPSGDRELQYTNQANNGNPDDATMEYGPAPGDATSAVHEYRIDWTEESTEFYLDGVLQKTFTTNVPSQAGPWVWNNWVNGDPDWTRGPPTTDAVFKIQKIIMEYNRA